MLWSLICCAASESVVVDGTTTTSPIIRSWTVWVIAPPGIGCGPRPTYHWNTLRLTNSGIATALSTVDTVASGGDGKPGQAPLEHAVGQPPGLTAVASQQPDRVVGEHAVRPAAVRHHLALGDFGQPVVELVERDADRAGDVPGGILLRRSYIQHG